jgi:signal transduction histidine kinase
VSAAQVRPCTRQAPRGAKNAGAAAIPRARPPLRYMDLRESALRAYESSGPVAALGALARSAAAQVPLRSAAWVSPAGEVLAAWPEGTAPCPDLVSSALSAPHPTHHSLAADPSTGPLTALLIPLGDGEPGEGTLVVTVEGSPDAAELRPEAWQAPAAALAAIARVERMLRQAEEERDELRHRAEESEALHVLGLAANRTLDPDEVLDLVARFTRTLLGAHYVTVSTSEGGVIRTLASVGLRAAGEAGDDPFAGQVANAGQPLTLQAGSDGWPAEVLAFHAREEMRVGLGVPLSLFGETFGALVIGYRRDYDLTPRDTRLALTLAGHAAVAISNAWLHRALADRSRALERAYEELRWSAEAKERFFASMSHELRTPLNAILGYHSLILDGVVGELPEGTRPFLEKAHRATDGLLLLVNDVLDLSKLEAGRVDLAVLHTSLAAVVEDAVATVEPMAARKGIALRPSLGTTRPRLRTDPDRVRQILINLLSNAVKFTDTGSVDVTMEMVPAAPGEQPDGSPPHPGWLHVVVADTGPGIAPGDQERIFHDFEQVAGASARGGTGLGLPISRRLARLLGGDVLLESSPGHGATFTLRLPLDPAEPSAPGDAAPAGAGDGA